PDYHVVPVSVTHHQQCYPWRRPVPGERAGIAGEVLHHALDREDRIDPGGNRTKPVHRSDRLDQDHGARSGAGPPGPDRGQGGRVALSSGSADDEQLQLLRARRHRVLGTLAWRYLKSLAAERLGEVVLLGAGW